MSVLTIKSLCLWKYHRSIAKVAYKNKNRRIKNIARDNMYNTTFSDIGINTIACYTNNGSDITIGRKYNFQKSKSMCQKCNIKQCVRHKDKIGTIFK